ncbi:uncharacterized protein BXZ73DRAFT_54565 [Epithele typhae]|uniref:uncharacterized protein n=1 Tax=Epithele typhae TaxID=378194 RepID=UPI0020087DD1|nr:uncharacterized protein BXZ73DRAFT_54565 [Epithele typhae]KAH9915055.1 hypothetical protein BXZ73DRAFT_54565 [Epithele typhae]
MELAATESEGSGVGSLKTLDTSSKEALRDREDIHVHQGIRPDLSVYFKETLEDRSLAEIRGATESKAPAKHKEDSAKGKAKQRRTPKEERLRQERSRYAGKASFAHIVVPIEAKTKRTLSAFSFPTSKVDAENPDSAEPPIVEKQSATVEDALGQISEYCATIFNRQHRTRLIALYVHRFEARIIVFDRGSCVASTPFKWGSEGHPALHQFFWRLAHMTRTELGFDHTVVPSLPPDVYQALDNFTHKRLHDTLGPLVRQYSRALSFDTKTKQWPLQLMTIAGKRYVVGCPTTRTSTLFGNARRYYVAYCVEDEELRTVKDYWRFDDPNIPPEHAVYKLLNDHGVRNVPSCDYGGDVPDEESDGPQRTMVLRRTPEEPQIGLPAHVHYRIVLREVFQPLSEFKNFQSLCGFMADAMEAHYDAWHKARVLHRAVSTYSIGILTAYDDEKKEIKPQTALLVDWDFAKTRDEIENGTKPRRQDIVPGAWLHRSALSLRFPTRGYGVQDDVESFLHMFEYCVIRRHETNCPDFEITEGKDTVHSRLMRVVKEVYTAHKVRASDGAHVGGRAKFKNMKRETPWMKPIPANTTLTDLLQRIAGIGYMHYVPIDDDDFEVALLPSPELAGASSATSTSQMPSATGDTLRVAKENGPLSSHTELLNLFREFHKKSWPESDLSIAKNDLFESARITIKENTGYWRRQ